MSHPMLSYIEEVDVLSGLDQVVSVVHFVGDLVLPLFVELL